MPQAPPPQHPPIGMRGALDWRGAEAEKTENFCASSLLWQEGHSGSVEPITSFSKLEWQSLQTYSKIGMVNP
jgi:hypothetical protein